MCKTLTEISFPDSLRSIGAGAFSSCENLRKIVFPKGLESIGESACAFCTNLSEVIWPENLLSIGDSAFTKTGLGNATLPNGLMHIGLLAFSETQIRKAILPKSVRTLGWGTFSCVPEIELYDSIDPDAKDASEGIDTLNGNPNSLVGFIGIGPASAMWECAANHRWVNYTIIVKSAKTDEIKYKVWMGADRTQRNYYCFLSSAWGHNATFAFERLDEYFPHIRGDEHKRKIAEYRLAYPVDLTEDARAKYESYLNKHR